MEVNTKKIAQDVLKFTVLGGSAVIAVNSIMQLTKSTDLKSAIMPAITLLVGVSAFSYAMTADKVGFVPELNKNEVSGEEDKSEALGRVSSFDVNSGVGFYNPQIYSKLKSGEKICNCAYLKKPEKICSKSVRCNDCCEGSGIGGHRDTDVTRD